MIGEEHNYRETVSVWFRSIFILQPDGEAMTLAPLSFQIHALIGMALFALWPFTRLVHAFSAPVGYLFRPYIVYRSRGQPPGPAHPSDPSHAAGAGRNVQLLRMPQHPDDRQAQRRTRRHRQQHLRTAGRIPRAGRRISQDRRQRSSASCCTRTPGVSRSDCSPK